MSEKILFVFEGKQLECRFLECIKNAFASEFDGSDIVVCYETNIYILWKELSDDSDLDLIDHLREKSDENKTLLKGLKSSKIPQRFLFFDSDLHHGGKMERKLEIISEALNFFNDETDNGKLFISYPMVESLIDCFHDKSECFGKCVTDINLRKKYKDVVHKNKNRPGNSVDLSVVRDNFFYFIEINYEKACCLLYGEDKIPQSIGEAKAITQRVIFNHQRDYLILNKKLVVVLSAFPFFIIDYFQEEYLSEQYNTMVQNFKPKENCGFKHIIEHVQS